MLHLNLSTRPFFNERAVHWLLGVVAVALLALSFVNGRELFALSARQTTLRQQVEADEAQARDLRQRANALQAQLNQDELKTVLAAAREANALIDRRTFSWTELFNYLESTLPADVMLVAVQPKVESNHVVLTLGVVGRRTEDVEAFIDRLEKTGAFSQLLSTDERLEDDGTVAVTLTGRYVPSRRPEPAPATGTSEGAAATEPDRGDGARLELVAPAAMRVGGRR